MSIIIAAVVVLAQVALFQFIAVMAHRTLVRQELGHVDGPTPEYLEKHANSVPRRRIGMGVALCVLALLPVTGLITGSAGKLLLLVVSLISASDFVSSLSCNRKIMRALADQAPGGGVRRASLQNRFIGQWYPPVLEIIPILILIATTVVLVSTPGVLGTSAPVEDGFHGDRVKLLGLYGLQMLFVFGALWRTIRKGVEIESMAAHIPSLRNRPEAAMRLGEQLAGVQLRYFMFAKIAVALLLGATIVEKLLQGTGGTAAGIWDALTWVIVGLLLVSFALYLRKVGKISREMQHAGEPASHNAASAG